MTYRQDVTLGTIAILRQQNQMWVGSESGNFSWVSVLHLCWQSEWVGWSKKVPKIAHVIKGWFLTWRWREFLFRRTGSDKLPRYCAGESPRMRQMLILRTILLLLYCAIILFNEFINWYPNFCKWSSLKKKMWSRGFFPTHLPQEWIRFNSSTKFCCT